MYLDKSIGTLVDYLEAEGWMENSIIVVASDNGGCPGAGGSNYPLRGLKHSYWEGGVKVYMYHHIYKTCVVCCCKQHNTACTYLRSSQSCNVLHVTLENGKHIVILLGGGSQGTVCMWCIPFTLDMVARVRGGVRYSIIACLSAIKIDNAISLHKSGTAGGGGVARGWGWVWGWGVFFWILPPPHWASHHQTNVHRTYIRVRIVFASASSSESKALNV